MRRGTAHERGYGARWQKARDLFISQHPLCAACERRGVLASATDVDHITPHKGDYMLFWDRANWQSLCHSCHARKTAQEDGGFGNKGRIRARADCGLDGLPVDPQHHWNRVGGG